MHNSDYLKNKPYNIHNGIKKLPFNISWALNLPVIQ